MKCRGENEMKKLLMFFERVPDNSILFYGSVFSILLTFVAAFTLYHWPDNYILVSLAYVIFLFDVMLLVYISEFFHVKPLWLSIFLSAIITIITGIVIILYLKYIKGDDVGVSPPIAIITVGILSKLFKKILKLK